MNMEIEYRF